MADSKSTDRRAQAIDAYDALDAKLGQLQSALIHTCGQSRDGFEGLADDVRQDYMALLADLADDCRQQLRKLHDATIAPLAQEARHD